MFFKSLILAIAGVGVAASMLAMRQQRFDTAHEMAVLHKQIDNARRSMWDQQVKISNEVQPAKLEASIARSGLKLEPLVQVPDRTAPPASGAPTRVADRSRHR